MTSLDKERTVLFCIFNEAFGVFKYLRENVVYIQQTQLLIKWGIT